MLLEFFQYRFGIKCRLTVPWDPAWDIEDHVESTEVDDCGVEDVGASAQRERRHPDPNSRGKRRRFAEHVDLNAEHVEVRHNVELDELLHIVASVNDCALT